VQRLLDAMTMAPAYVRNGRLDILATSRSGTQAELDAGTRSDGLTSDERDELVKLRRENRRLQEDVEILKRATAFFAKETR
jgi:transposase-like protein